MDIDINFDTKLKVAFVVAILSAIAGFSVCHVSMPNKQLLGIIVAGGLGFVGTVVSVKIGFLIALISCIIAWNTWPY